MKRYDLDGDAAMSESRTGDYVRADDAEEAIERAFREGWEAHESAVAIDNVIRDKAWRDSAAQGEI